MIKLFQGLSLANWRVHETSTHRDEKCSFSYGYEGSGHCTKTKINPRQHFPVYIDVSLISLKWVEDLRILVFCELSEWHTHTQAIYKKYDVTCSPSQNNFNIVKKKKSQNYKIKHNSTFIPTYSIKGTEWKFNWIIYNKHIFKTDFLYLVPRSSIHILLNYSILKNTSEFKRCSFKSMKNFSDFLRFKRPR